MQIIATTVHDPEILDIITYTGHVARAAWEPIWPLWKLESGHPGPFFPLSADTCIPTSLALRAVLDVMVPEYRWTVTGGRPTKRTPLGGYLNPVTGRSEAHLWVVGLRGDSELVVDITADQFGGEPVIVGVGERYRPNLTRGLLAQYALNERSTVARLYAAFDREMAARRPSCSTPA